MLELTRGIEYREAESGAEDLSGNLALPEEEQHCGLLAERGSAFRADSAIYSRCNQMLRQGSLDQTHFAMPVQFQESGDECQDQQP